MCLAPFQSQRDCVLQPRVARNELPWVGGPLNLNPERVPPMTLNKYEKGEGKSVQHNLNVWPMSRQPMRSDSIATSSLSIGSVLPSRPNAKVLKWTGRR